MRDWEYVKSLPVGVRHIGDNCTVPAPDPAAVRMRRHILLAGCQELVYPFWREKIDKETGEVSSKSEFRVSVCCRFAVDDETVNVYANESAIGFSGVVRCGNVHACPICCAKIMRLRAEQISQIFEHVYQSGGSAVMVTFTAAHRLGDSLALLLEQFKEAKRDLGKHRAFRRILSDFGIEGTCSATEITYSSTNGWHPHQHDSWFLNSLVRPDCELLATELFKIWHSCCQKNGLETQEFFREKRLGVDVRPAWNASEYMTKFDRERTWSLPSEMTAGRLKMSKGGHSLTPWLILEQAILRGRDSDAAKLWIEYLRASKGKSVISLRGCKKLCERLGIPTRLDDFADANRAGEGEIIDSITANQFDAVTRQGGLGRLLEAARQGENLELLIRKEFFKQPLKHKE